MSGLEQPSDRILRATGSFDPSMNLSRFHLHVFVFFAVFFWLLTSSHIAFWSEKILDMVSILLNLPRLDLWPRRGSVLEGVLCALEKNVYSSALGGTFYKCLLGPSGLMRHPGPVSPC